MEKIERTEGPRTQEVVLDSIKTNNHTRKEICLDTGFSSGTVHNALQRLRKYKLITIKQEKPGSYSLYHIKTVVKKCK